MRYFNEFERYLGRQMDAPGYRGLPLDVAEDEEVYAYKKQKAKELMQLQSDVFYNKQKEVMS